MSSLVQVVFYLQLIVAKLRGSSDNNSGLCNTPVKGVQVSCELLYAGITPDQYWAFIFGLYGSMIYEFLAKAR